MTTRRRRLAVSAALALATILCLVAALSVWIDRQALNTANWTDTSAKLLADQRIDDAVGGYLVDELFAHIDVAHALQDRLPAQLEGLAGPAAAAVRDAADRAAPRILRRPKIQRLWVEANRDAHRRLMRIVTGGGPYVSTASGVVTLDLHALVATLAADLGIQAKDGSRVSIPKDAGTLVIMRADQLKAAQRIAKAIRGLAILLPLLALALFALSLWLAGGWRRVVLRRAGWCMAAVGLLVLVVSRIAGHAITDALVRAPSNAPAARDVWSIATALLHAIAVALVVYGILVVACAWLAGPSRPATRARAWLAPTLRNHPGTAYATASAALLVAVAWGPTPALRQPLGVAILAVLLALGVTSLRRQSTAELNAAGASPPT